MRKQATISNLNISVWLHMAMITLVYYILVVLSAFHIGTLLLHISARCIYYIISPSCVLAFQNGIYL